MLKGYRELKYRGRVKCDPDSKLIFVFKAREIITFETKQERKRKKIEKYLS